MTLEDLYNMNFVEIYDYILFLKNKIDMLEYELKVAEKKYSNKINKDFEDNKNMISKLLESVISQYDN